LILSSAESRPDFQTVSATEANAKAETQEASRELSSLTQKRRAAWRADRKKVEIEIEGGSEPAGPGADAGGRRLESTRLHEVNGGGDCVSNVTHRLERRPRIWLRLP
jgi:hypothetical protein